MVPGALEVVSVPRSGAEQPKKSESGFHARNYTLSVYTDDILREEEKLRCDRESVPRRWAFVVRAVPASGVVGRSYVPSADGCR